MMFLSKRLNDDLRCLNYHPVVRGRTVGNEPKSLKERKKILMVSFVLSTRALAHYPLFGEIEF
jgi:hypothetical protein